MSHDEEAALDAAWRKASAADAGAPSAATRAAIMAEAARVAAQARQAQPAANEPRYLWRAVAGVAVLGVAVLLWRQVDHRLPGAAPQVEVPVLAEQKAADAAADVAPAETGAQLEAPAATLPAAAPAGPPPAAPVAQSNEERVATSDSLVAQESVAAKAMEPLRERAVADALRAEARGQSAERASAVMRAAPPRAAALLQQHFPQHEQRATPATFWLLLQPDGTPLQAGELQAGGTLADVASQLQLTGPGGAPPSWRLETVQNARGVAVTLAVAEVQGR